MKYILIISIILVLSQPMFGQFSAEVGISYNYYLTDSRIEAKTLQCGLTRNINSTVSIHYGINLTRTKTHLNSILGIQFPFSLVTQIKNSRFQFLTGILFLYPEIIDITQSNSYELNKTKYAFGYGSQIGLRFNINDAITVYTGICSYIDNDYGFIYSDTGLTYRFRKKIDAEPVQ